MPPFDQIGSWTAVGLVLGGVAKFVLDLITARFRGRKEGAEGAAIIVNSATAYAEKLAADARTATDEARAVRLEFGEYRREQEGRWRLMEARFRDHARWDTQVARRLAELGEEVSDPPPLYTDA